MKNDATEKIVMLQSSMRCFVLGLIGVLLGVGLPFALVALWQGGRARVIEKRHWNAARPYRLCGTVFAAISTILWVCLLLVILLNLVSFAYGSDGGGGDYGFDGGGE